MKDFMAIAVSDSGRGGIFDLDGVLVDTGWAHKQSWYDLAEKEGFSMTDEFFYSTFGMQNYQIIPMLLGKEASSSEIDRLSDWKEQRYREIIAEKLVPAEGARSLLCDLKGEGFRLAVGSSAPRANLELVLDCTDLRDYFDAYVTGQDVTRGKPAPDTFLKAAGKLSLDASHCIVVEDAVQGVEAGRAAGMAVVAITTTRSRADLQKADIIVDSLTQLQARQFVELLNKRIN
jgi:beta-phosphoglucomutase